MIASEVSRQYPRMIKMFDQEVENVRVLFNEHVQRRDPSDLGKNMPVTAGELQATMNLRNRLRGSYDQFQASPEPAFHGAEATAVYSKYNKLLTLMREHDEHVFSLWASDVAEKTDMNLNRNLLVRDAATQKLSVNFDPQLVAVLREVKYLQAVAAGLKEIPKRAEEIFAKNEVFRQLLGNLNIATTEYNRIKDTMIEVEEPLIRGELAEIDATLEKAVSVYTWVSDESPDFALALKATVVDLSDRLQKAKANVKTIVR